MSAVLLQLPNWLTYLRLALIPLFVFLLAGEPSRPVILVATFIFVIAAITDYADGYLARRFGAVSNLGKLLDPLADKVLVMAALVMLIAQRSDIFGDPWVPGWMVVLVLAREIWVTGLRAIAATEGVVVAAGGAGKVKSGLQMVAIVLLLLHDVRILGPFSCQWIGTKLLLLSILFSYWGACDYTARVLFGARKDGAQYSMRSASQDEPRSSSNFQAADNQSLEPHSTPADPKLPIP